MATATQAQPTLEELRYALSNPAAFGLKEFVWYAIDPPEWFLHEHPHHALAARLGTSAAGLDALSALWLTSSNKRVLDTTQAKAVSLLTELNGSRRAPDGPN